MIDCNLHWLGSVGAKSLVLRFAAGRRHIKISIYRINTTERQSMASKIASTIRAILYVLRTESTYQSKVVLHDKCHPRRYVGTIEVPGK